MSMSWEMEKFGAAGKRMVIYWKPSWTKTTGTGTARTELRKRWTERKFKAGGEKGHCKRVGVECGWGE